MSETLTIVQHSVQYLDEIQNAFVNWQADQFQPRSPEFYCLELCGEAGELANLEKKIWKGAQVPASMVADEAADVFIALMNFANARGINLSDAVADKASRIKPTK